MLHMYMITINGYNVLGFKDYCGMLRPHCDGPGTSTGVGSEVPRLRATTALPYGACQPPNTGYHG